MTAVETETELDVGPVAELTRGEGRAYAVRGRQVAVFLLADGTVRALDAVCPHRQGPIADGQADGDVVLCPLHLYAFSLRTGACTTDGIGSLTTYSARIVDGRIRIAVPTS